MEFTYETKTSDSLYEVSPAGADMATSSNGIVSFDASDDNMLAVGFSNECVGIYNENSELIGNFSIEAYGGQYYLSWQEDTLWIFIVRNKLAVHVVDVTSDCVSVQEVYSIENSSANNAVWREYHTKNTITKGGTTYELIQSLPFGADSDTIIKRLPDGTSVECLSVRKESMANITAEGLTMLAGLAFLGVIWLICRGFQNKKQ